MRCTIIHSKIHKYPYNFIYKTVPITASSYPKIKILTSILLEKMKNVKFSYNFGYFHSHEASLALMLMSVIIYNINHSQLCETVKH